MLRFQDSASLQRSQHLLLMNSRSFLRLSKIATLECLSPIFAVKAQHWRPDPHFDYEVTIIKYCDLQITSSNIVVAPPP